MRKSLLFFIGLCLFFVICADTLISQEAKGTLTIVLSGFNNDNGKALLVLCDSKENYDKSAGCFRSAQEKIKIGKVELTFKDIPFGYYAVKVYHDENGNDKLDTGIFGIPLEAYGFSNNARGVFGPPKYEDAQFLLNKAELTINISLK
jgi:uncharacterized protein (DUF2141 family)